jgi:hypothetical protein
MNHTLIQMINYITLEKILLYIYIYIYDVRIYFTFISFIKFLKKRIDKILGIK